MTLHVIKELMLIVSENGFKQKERPGELFAYLKENPEATNLELIQYFYGDNPHGKIYLSNIKRKLVNLLQNHILNQLPEEYNRDIQKDYFYCHKMNAVANILLGQDKRKAAVKAAEDAFVKALKHDFTPIILSTATLLRRHYGVIIGDHKKLKYYHEIVEKYTQIQTLEQKAEFFYIDIRSNFPKSKKVPLDLTQRAQAYVEELSPFLKQVDSYRFHLLSYNVIVALEQIKGDPKKIVEACEKALAYFNSNGGVPKGVLFTFNYHMIPSLIQLNDFEKLNKSIQFCLKLYKEESHNWMILQQYKIIAHLYRQEFEMALVLIQATKNQAQKHESLYEMWVIMEAYGHFLTGRKYRLQKFLNEVPIYEKDKRGMNTNVLIIQILFYLQRRKYEQIVERIEAIKAYSYKYLRQDDTFRSNCFIRMLLELKPCGFKESIVEKRVAPLFEKLKLAPIRDIDVEPVRYEVVWEKVLELLK